MHPPVFRFIARLFTGHFLCREHFKPVSLDPVSSGLSIKIGHNPPKKGIVCFAVGIGVVDIVPSDIRQ